MLFASCRLATLVAVALAPLATAVVAQPADLVLRGGRIHTVDAAARTVQAVAIRGGRFIAVGTDAEAMATAGPATRVIDLTGRTAVPGLIDTHLHQLFMGVSAPNVQLIEARSVADVQRAIAERAVKTAPGQWVVAFSGWHESLLAEGRMPTRWEIDKAAPDHPVLIPRGGHVVTANSKALEAAGITRDTANPPGGVIVRDPATGEATGVLLQNAANLVRRVAPRPPPSAEQARLLAAAMRELNGYGIVGVVEPGIDEAGMAVYRNLRDAGQMTVRTDVLYRAMRLEDVKKGVAAVKAERNDEWLRFVGIKFPLDGGVEGGRMTQPYRLVPGEQNDPAYRGVLLLPPGGEEEYVEALKAVAEAGLQAQTHAVGDETIDLIVRAYRRVDRETRPIRDLNWAIMHIFLPRDAAIAGMRELGIVATAQNHPVLLGHNQRRWWGDERAAYAIPIRKLNEAGILVGGGTDGPVVPVDPFLSMWWMTTRGTLSGYKLGPEHAISAADALRLYTINNARIMGVAGERGSIEVGKLADLTVLSQDVLSVPPEAIRDTRALMTVVGGKVVFER